MSHLVKENVEYDPVNHLVADLYAPDTPATAAVIDIHGGGWFRGDKAKDADWAEALTAAGYYVIVPNYRLAAYPAPLDDMHSLMAWLRQADLPFPLAKIAAVGGSAGGNMAVELAIKYGIPAVSLSGILDIESWLKDHEDVVPQEGDTTNFNAQASATINQDGANDAFYKWFVLKYLPNEADWHAATPCYHTTVDTGPLFLANSLHEFVPTSGVLQLAASLTAKRVPFTARLMRGTAHAKGYLPEAAPAIMQFLRENLA